MVHARFHKINFIATIDYNIFIMIISFRLAAGGSASVSDL